jgi:deoxyhypusine monooxygenase
MSSFSLETLRACILDLSQPIAKRTHAAFYLRTDGSEDAAKIIAEALAVKENSSLMRHELAYILGQMQHKSSCSILSSILSDESDDTLVRHESAEALGAIGDPSSLEVLSMYRSSEIPDISETCQIAVDLINWKNGEGKMEPKVSSSYLSVDPAPPLSANLSIADLQSTLLDKSLSLFQRYRAMFTLRNINNDDSALALVQGLKDDSALFRHEIGNIHIS